MKISNSTVGTIELSDKELSFLFYSLNSFKSDVNNLITSMVEQSSSNASINKDWIRWLQNNEKSLREKLFSELEVHKVNLLNIFYLENDKEQIPGEELAGL
jgi:hypothetical protein